MAVRQILIASGLLSAGCGRLGFGGGDTSRSDARSADATSDAFGDPHLIAYYPLDTLSLGMTPDATGHGHDATCTSCPLVELSPRDHAAHFTGSSQRLDVVGTGLDTTSGYTVTAWINADSAPASVGCFLGKEYGTTDVNSWQLCLRDTLAFYYGSSGTNGSVNSTQMLTLNAWHHVAIRWDGVIKTLSLDGVDLFSIDATIQFDGGAVHFGADLDFGAQVAPFAGSVDEIRIYDRALSSAEIAILAAP